MLAAGIDVISTVNIQHLESLNDVVFELTGVRVRETFPDRVLDEADEVVLVDLTPEELRDRIRAGKVYPQDRVEAALANFFRPRTCQSLRQLALREVAEDVEERRVPQRAAGDTNPLIRQALRRADPGAGGAAPARSGCCAGPGARDSGWEPTSTRSGCTRPAQSLDERRPDRAGGAAPAGRAAGRALPGGGGSRPGAGGRAGGRRPRQHLRLSDRARTRAGSIGCSAGRGWSALLDALPGIDIRLCADAVDRPGERR